MNISARAGRCRQLICLCLLEMAEHHDAAEILRIARDLVYKVQTLIENK